MGSDFVAASGCYDRGLGAEGVKSFFPILAVTLAILVIWYGAAVWLNASWAWDQAGRAGRTLSFSELVTSTMTQDRPRLPAPHQVAAEFRKSVFETKVTSKRSLVYHAGVTLSATVLGFVLGMLGGIALAVGIVHSRALDLSVMPWAVASQTIPILAIAPMVIVVLNSAGVSGLWPKALIAAWLSFFPVVVGMVKGLRSPDAMQFDLLRTWSASPAQTLGRLRLPASMPWLFASLKVSVAAALVGTIVAELPAGAGAGIGARLLSGSYYGQTAQIWAALLAAALLAGLLIAAVGLAERLVGRRMGARPV